MRGHRGRVLAGVLLSVLLLWWTLRDVSLAEVAAAAGGTRADWLLAMVVTATATFLVRALRWHVLLLPAHPDTGFGGRFAAVCVGAMGNNLLPLRVGEFARAFALSRVERIGAGAAFGSLVVERVFDGLVLAGFLAGTLALPVSPLVGGGPGTVAVRRVAAGAALLFALAALCLWLLARFPRRTLELVEATAGRFLPPDLTARGIAVLASFLEGLGALHRPGVFLRALGWTLAVWLLSGVSIACGLAAFGIGEPGLVGSLFLQALIGFAVALPSSPGFFGPFEAASRLGLGLFGVGAAEAVSFALVYHLLTFVPVTLLGLGYAHRIGLRWGELRRSEAHVEAEVEGAGGGESGGSTAGERGARRVPGDGGRPPGDGGRPPGDGGGAPDSGGAGGS